MDAENNIAISYITKISDILKLEVRPRYVKSRTYKCFVEYEPYSTGYLGIKQHYCECPNGNRTVGCCSYVAAVLQRVTGEAEQSQQLENFTKDPIIYNSVSSCQNAITWAEFMRLNADYGLQIPSTQSIWCYFFRLNRHLWIHNLFILFFHFIPALIVDAACILTHRKPMLLKAYKKIHKFSGVISYFCTQQWKFKNDNVVKLWDKLNEVDQVKYKFNVEKLDWNLYLQRHIRGLRIFLLKDPLTTIDEARIRYTKFRIAHLVLATLFFLLFTWMAYKLISHFILLITV